MTGRGAVANADGARSAHQLDTCALNDIAVAGELHARRLHLAARVVDRDGSGSALEDGETAIGERRGEDAPDVGPVLAAGSRDDADRDPYGSAGDEQRALGVVRRGVGIDGYLVFAMSLYLLPPRTQ